jgi:hypothetical protein
MKKLSFLACLLLLLFQQAIAQTNRVSGRVTSSGTGNPAEGISVVVKGKNPEPPPEQMVNLSFRPKRVRNWYFPELVLQPKK